MYIFLFPSSATAALVQNKVSRAYTKIQADSNRVSSSEPEPAPATGESAAETKERMDANKARLAAQAQALRQRAAAAPTGPPKK